VGAVGVGTGTGRGVDIPQGAGCQRGADVESITGLRANGVAGSGASERVASADVQPGAR